MGTHHHTGAPVIYSLAQSCLTHDPRATHEPYTRYMSQTSFPHHYTSTSDSELKLQDHGSLTRQFNLQLIVLMQHFNFNNQISKENICAVREHTNAHMSMANNCFLCGFVAFPLKFVCITVA